MIDLRERKTALATLVNQANALHADIEAKGTAATEEDRNKLRALIADGQKKREELHNLEALNEMDAEVNTPAGQRKAAQRAGAAARKDWGAQVVESRQFKENNGRVMSDVPVENNIKRMIKTVSSLFTGTVSINEPVLYDMERQPGIIDIARQQPPSVIDMVNHVRTSSGALEYVLMTARQNLAAVVPESSSGDGGLKPQGDLTFTLLTATVKTIAEWIRTSRQILSDAPRLQDTINTELIYQVLRALEDQILNGDGSGNNFTGVYATSGIQVRTQSKSAPVGRGQTTDDNKMDTLRRAITDIYLAFYTPTGIVVNPADGEDMELAKDDVGHYLEQYDSATGRLWRVPVTETPATAQGTAAVASWMLAATLWDREEANVRISENVGDDFKKNMVVLLGEVRAAFAVTRPLAVEKVTFA